MVITRGSRTRVRLRSTLAARLRFAALHKRHTRTISHTGSTYAPTKYPAVNGAIRAQTNHATNSVRLKTLRARGVSSNHEAHHSRTASHRTPNASSMALRSIPVNAGRAGLMPLAL